MQEKYHHSHKGDVIASPGLGEDMQTRFPKKTKLDNKDMVILQMLKNGNPSIVEMAQAILVHSTGTVYNRLEFMQEQGLVIQPAKLKARSRKITSAGLAKLKEEGLG